MKIQSLRITRSFWDHWASIYNHQRFNNWANVIRCLKQQTSRTWSYLSSKGIGCVRKSLTLSRLRICPLVEIDIGRGENISCLRVGIMSGSHHCAVTRIPWLFLNHVRIIVIKVTKEVQHQHGLDERNRLTLSVHPRWYGLCQHRGLLQGRARGRGYMPLVYS